MRYAALCLFCVLFFGCTDNVIATQDNGMRVVDGQFLRNCDRPITISTWDYMYRDILRVSIDKWNTLLPDSVVYDNADPDLVIYRGTVPDNDGDNFIGENLDRLEVSTTAGGEILSGNAVIKQTIVDVDLVMVIGVHIIGHFFGLEDDPGDLNSIMSTAPIPLNGILTEQDRRLLYTSCALEIPSG